ncbi:MAG: hypothetical protein NAOJABEB_01478 [Steroidobacteraceae bacterium]|nr:hypothetical protein [Steroidobacteraceae bacterium]
MDSGSQGASVTEMQDASESAQIEALRQALIAGEGSGEPQPFDFAAFARRKLAQCDSG